MEASLSLAFSCVLGEKRTGNCFTRNEKVGGLAPGCRVRRNIEGKYGIGSPHFGMLGWIEAQKVEESMLVLGIVN